MQTVGKRMLIAAVMLMMIAGCALSVGMWRLWTAAGRPAAPAGAGGPAIVTPTLAANRGSTGAAGQDSVAPGEANALTGAFEGTVFGDAGSSALLRLELVQQGTVVAGTASIGAGLQIDAGGFCGSIPIPAMSLQAAEQLNSSDSRHLSTTSNVSVEGFEIPVALEATLSADGQTITAAATLDTPAVCTKDPTVSGTLTRVGG